MEGQTCVICSALFQEFGHSAEPVKRGRCCNLCNDAVVIPERIRLMRLQDETVHKIQTAGRSRPRKKTPFLGALADAEGERDDARRHSKQLRALLGRVLEEIEDLPEDLREPIEKALAS
jgi:hypothetical protein